MNKLIIRLVAVGLLVAVVGVVVLFNFRSQLGYSPEASAADKKSQPFLATVFVQPVVKQEVEPVQKVVGTIFPTRTSKVGSAASGRVETFLVDEGDYVEKGQPVAELRTGIIEAEVAAAVAMVKSHEAEVEYLEKSTPQEMIRAESALGKKKALLKYLLSKEKRILELKQNVSQEEVDEVISLAKQAVESVKEEEAALKMLEEPRKQKIAEAKAKRDAAAAEAKRLQEQLNRHTMKSPFNGYVTREYTEAGEWVLQGALIAEIAELDEVDIEIPVLEDYIRYFQTGLKVKVEVSALPGRKFEGEVKYINPQANLKTRTFPVKVRVPNEAHGKSVLLKAGMLATVEVPVAQKQQALLVHRDALVLGGKKKLIYVIDNGVARAVEVELGVSVGDLVQIFGKVEPGEWVAVQGNERIRPGQPVAMIKKDNPAN